MSNRQQRRAARAANRGLMSGAWITRRTLAGEGVVEREPMPRYVDRLFAAEVAALGLEPDAHDARRERNFLAAIDARVDAHEDWLQGGL